MNSSGTEFTLTWLTWLPQELEQFKSLRLTDSNIFILTSVPFTENICPIYLWAVNSHAKVSDSTSRLSGCGFITGFDAQ
jgi:hypothetical protein